jgi:hypothetical protein
MPSWVASVTTVHLEYKRPGERDVAPEAIFSLTVAGTRQ